MAKFDQELDASGLNCPLPILRAKKALNGMQRGEVLKVISTDKGFLSRRLGFSMSLAERFAGALMGEIDDRLMRARYGR